MKNALLIQLRPCLVDLCCLTSATIDEVLDDALFFRGQDLEDSADEAGVYEDLDLGVELPLPDGRFFHGYFSEDELVAFVEV